MQSSTSAFMSRLFNGRALMNTVVLAVIMLCLQSTASLGSARVAPTQSERYAHNAAAATLYAQLTALDQPSSNSEVTRALYQFINHNEQVDGATLLNARGELVAQIGAGNENLESGLTHASTARVPIKSAGQLQGHAVLAFRTRQSNVHVVRHYLTLAAVSFALTVLITRLLSVLCRMVTHLRSDTP